MRIALDAMGGDDAPAVNVDGAVRAVDAHPDLDIQLVGDVERLTPLLDASEYDKSRITLVAADGCIEMHEKPTEALRKKPNSSIAVCWRMMASKEVDAVVSAGNTGAVVAAGLRTRLFLKGVKRPGIAVVLPTQQGRTVLMDVGANPGARADHLLQYGVMGSIYAQDVLGIASPRVGLMNIGSEDGKGNELVREACALFETSALGDRYSGFVEGRGLYEGEADVVICEGFVGNVVLKVSEGMANMMLGLVAKEMIGSLDVERAQAAESLKAMTSRFEYNEIGGAPLLGIDGVCIICHGSSDARSIANALQGAAWLKDHQINEHIVAELSNITGPRT